MAYVGDTGERHKMATKKAMQMSVDLSNGEIEGSQLGIITHLKHVISRVSVLCSTLIIQLVLTYVFW